MESAITAAAGLATLIVTLKALIHACIAVPVVSSTFHPRRNTTMPAVATGTAVQPKRMTINADLLHFMDHTANHYAAQARGGHEFAEIVGTAIPFFIDEPRDIELVLWAAELGHSEGAFVRAAGQS